MRRGNSATKYRVRRFPKGIKDASTKAEVKRLNPYLCARSRKVDRLSAEAIRRPEKWPLKQNSAYESAWIIKIPSKDGVFDFIEIKRVL